MIVDDNAKIRETIRKVIQSPSDEIIEFADASSALSACVFEKPDWVLMDIKMPGMDGIEAARLIHDIFPTSRVTIVTDYADERHRKAAEEAGADSFVAKENLTELRRIARKTKRES